MVGERGPELFVPSQSGSIVPNGASSGVNINISNVSFGDKTDIDYLIGEIKRTLTRELQLSKLGIY